MLALCALSNCNQSNNQEGTVQLAFTQTFEYLHTSGRVCAERAVAPPPGLPCAGWQAIYTCIVLAVSQVLACTVATSDLLFASCRDLSNCTHAA